MRILVVVVACIVSLQLTGCITLPEITERIKIKNMKGKPIEAAVSELGNPTKIYHIPAGTVYEWYSYHENVRNELVGSTTGVGPAGLTIYQERGDVTYRYKCLVRIFVDPATKAIADYTVEGNDCRSW